MNGFKKYWYTGFITLITQVYFRKISLYGKETIPACGPVLFIGLHKNGAVDGFVYHRVLAPVTFMLAAQLRRNPVVRLFFDGIEVTRDKDKGIHSNIAALKKCISFLEKGGRLFVFPEGTSTLGPAHLPFKEGAAILASRFDFSKDQYRIVTGEERIGRDQGFHDPVRGEKDVTVAVLDRRRVLSLRCRYVCERFGGEQSDDLVDRVLPGDTGEGPNGGDYRLKFHRGAKGILGING